MSVNISHLSFTELKALQEQVAIRIHEKEAEEKASVRRELEELAQNRGFDLKLLLGEGGGKKPAKKVAPKYRNPRNAEQTWTGRGRKPKWIVEALASGARLEDFII